MTIEKVILDWLNDPTNNLGVTAYTEEPEQPAFSYVLIEKTGSSRTNLVDTATFAVQSYGRTLLEASTLNNTVKKLMDRLIEIDVISKSQLSTDYNFTDTATRRYRYQAVYRVVYMEDNL